VQTSLTAGPIRRIHPGSQAIPGPETKIVRGLGKPILRLNEVRGTLQPIKSSIPPHFTAPRVPKPLIVSRVSPRGQATIIFQLPREVHRFVLFTIPRIRFELGKGKVLTSPVKRQEGVVLFQPHKPHRHTLPQGQVIQARIPRVPPPPPPLLWWTIKTEPIAFIPPIFFKCVYKLYKIPTYTDIDCGVYGGSGRIDTIFGGSGELDTIFGGSGELDTIFGGSGTKC
jgi:hypothetical protein